MNNNFLIGTTRTHNFCTLEAISLPIHSTNTTMESKYGLHGKLMATAGNAEQLASILLEASRLVSSAEGCHLYFVSRDQSTRDAVWVTEVWNSKEDHDNSLKVEGVKELIARAMPLLAGQPERGQQLDVLGGKGIDFHS